MPLFFMLSFLAARRTLYITTPYFVPDAQTRAAAAGRARAGVDVRILVPNEMTDAVPIRLAGHSYFEDLLRAGVRIYEYQPAMMHNKTVVVDGQWSIVGSANMDIRSTELNQENVLGILDAGFGRQLDAVFLADIEKAKEITLEDWCCRGPWARLKERASVLFAEQY
jgi:cardiolipin synthase A/B